jgi:hypothetical protein
MEAVGIGKSLGPETLSMLQSYMIAVSCGLYVRHCISLECATEVSIQFIPYACSSIHTYANYLQYYSHARPKLR